MLKRFTISVHRWLGVGLCLIFLLWFPSGIVMMYWGFPSVTAVDRVMRSALLDPATITLSPAEAYARLDLQDPPREVRLNTFDGRPVYRFRTVRGEALVYADTGEQQMEVSSALIERAASAWSGQPSNTARVESIDGVDQWTVEGIFRDLGPLAKYSWPDGQQVYVSEASGEVVQYTTSRSRFWAYMGAIPHWLYFAPLRKHGPQWSAVVIWSSGLGTLTALIGIVLGTWMYSPSKRFRYDGVPTSIPYRGQKRWHMVLGLVFGLGAATWAFSGMLSMDPFPVQRSGGAGGSGIGPRAIAGALRGSLRVDSFAPRSPRQVLSETRKLRIRELELLSFHGEPMYLATLERGDTRVISPSGEPSAEFDRQRIVDVVTKAAESVGLTEIRVLDEYDRYYLDRRRARPLPVILARLNDAEHSRYYIDPKTARLVGGYSSRNWTSRWLYHGLHSLDFPWLYSRRPLWDIVVIAFMVGGTSLAVTSLVLAWRVVRR